MTRIILLAINAGGFLWLSYLLRKQTPMGPSVVGAWTYLLALLWVGTFVWMVWRAREKPEQSSERREWFTPQVQIVVAILVLGFVFRSVQLDRLPWGTAGMHIDAAFNTEVAFRILDGKEFFVPVTPSIAFYRDSLTHYYLAGFYGVFGRDIETLRLACNVLAVFNCFLFFLILRQYTQSALAIAGATALYAFSGTDAIFAISGIEYIMATPFLLGSFLLFTRAMRTGRRVDAILAGFVWGAGFSSHYSFLYLGMVVPALAVLHFRAVRPWLASFMAAAFLGVLPKATYLVFNFKNYLMRIATVSQHDPSGNVFVGGVLWEHFKTLFTLLFRTQIDFKWLLPEDPIVPLLVVPLVVFGFGVAFVRPRRPEHVLMIVVTGLTVVVNVMAYSVDYRFTNWMPVLFLSVGIGLSFATETQRSQRLVKWVLSVWVGVLLIQSVSAYFSHTDNPRLRVHYRTEEVALAKSLKTLDPEGRFYVLGPDLTWRLEFFNHNNPDIRRPNYFLDRDMQKQYSAEGASTILKNLEQIMMIEAASTSPINIVVSPDSPYGELLSNHVSKRLTGVVQSVSIADPVTRDDATYYWIRVPAQSAGPVQTARDLLTKFETTGDQPFEEARGKLSLTTYTDQKQTLVFDRREVPAVLDFDFKNKTPYPWTWGVNFSLRWVGYLLVEKSGDYTVEATFDDGCRLSLDNRLVFADWVPGASRTRSAVLSMGEGWHRIQIDYFQFIDAAQFSFRMAPVSQSPASVPRHLFASDAAAGPVFGNPLTAFGEGMKLFDKGEYERAARHFGYIVRTFPKAPNADAANYYLAICSFKREQWDDTIRLFRELIEKYPKSDFVPEAYYHIAWCRELKGERAEAVKGFRFVAEKFPSSRWRGYAEDWLKRLQ